MRVGSVSKIWTTQISIALFNACLLLFCHFFFFFIEELKFTFDPPPWSNEIHQAVKNWNRIPKHWMLPNIPSLKTYHPPISLAMHALLKCKSMPCILRDANHFSFLSPFFFILFCIFLLMNNPLTSLYNARFQNQHHYHCLW